MRYTPLFFAIAAIPQIAAATTYLCVPEAAAVVSHNSNGIITSSVARTDKKWLLSSESGKWEVKFLGMDKAWFDRCDSEFFCASSNGFSGVFMREAEGGIFSVVWISKSGKETQLISETGKCSKIM